MIIRPLGIYEAFGDVIFQFGSSDSDPRRYRDPEQGLSLPVRWIHPPVPCIIGLGICTVVSKVF